jgi:hypothetical protein
MPDYLVDTLKATGSIRAPSPDPDDREATILEL